MAPSTDPVQERILERLETILSAIAESSTYYHTVNQVTRLEPSIVEINSSPAIIITPLGTTYDNTRSTVVGALAGAFRVQLTLLIRTASDAAKKIQQLIADVIRAILDDYSMNGLAINSRIVRDEVWIPNDSKEPAVYATLLVEIDYRTPRSDLTDAT